MARSEKQICWVVAHPEIGTAFVTADSWEQATVAAADFWGVPWGKYVAGMELRQKKEAHRHLCCRCGRIFHSPGALCEACIKILHTEEQETARRLKKTWYLGLKESAFGT